MGTWATKWQSGPRLHKDVQMVKDPQAQLALVFLMGGHLEDMLITVHILCNKEDAPV